MLLVAEKSRGKGFGVNGCDLSSIQPLCWTTKEGGGGLLVVSSGDTQQEVTDRLSLSLTWSQQTSLQTLQDTLILQQHASHLAY